MPRKPLKPKVRKQIIPEDQKKYLLHGLESDGFDFYLFRYNKDSQKFVWEKFKEEILSEWIPQNPCSRPFVWWSFDAPESRRLVSGLIEYCDVCSKDLRWGIDNNFLSYSSEDLPLFESQASYLKRLNLLDTKEVKFLNEHQKLFDPESMLNIRGLTGLVIGQIFKINE